MVLHVYKSLVHKEQLWQWTQEVEKFIAPRISEISRQVDEHQWRVIEAFREAGVSDYHLVDSTGYGYDDLGRETLEQVYAKLFGAEAALVRPQIISGTHAIAASLFGVLRPNDELVYITGAPYDTLLEVIGIRGKASGSLIDLGVSYREVELTPEGEVDWEGVRKALATRPRCVAIQRSRGYEQRPSFTIAEIEKMVHFVRKIHPEAIIFVDNCYGEFVEALEPTHVGADLLAGSLIKNPGGGLAKSGGYIVGRQEVVDLAASRLFAPGIGAEGGAMHGYQRDYFQGLFLAPHVVGEALKGAVFAAAMLEKAGFSTSPTWDAPRTDIIQQINLDQRELLIAFCQGIQAASPIDAHVTPMPSPMPGYADPVIMAGGTFVQGASIELSADGPLRPPYTVFMQGGLTYSHVKIGVLTALDRVLSAKNQENHF